jgi:hypothetical protein
MHGNIFAQNFRTDNGILREIFRHTAPDHQKTGGPRMYLDHGQFQKILNRVNGKMIVGAFILVYHQTEPRRTVGKRGAENRHMVFISHLNQGLFLLGMLDQVSAHFGDKLPR